MIDFKKIFLQHTDNIFLQLFRYGFVGGTAFVIDFGLLWALTEFLHLHYIFAATFSFIAGLTTNYFLSKMWVFNQTKVKSRTVEFLVFAFIGVIGLLFNDLIMYLATEKMAQHYLVSKIISTVIVFLWNFLARKFILFNSDSDHKRQA
jgi:putative flippase GtrA